VTDPGNALIHRIEISTSTATTLAGYDDGQLFNNGWNFTDGVGTNAQFSYPNCISISPDGLFALVTDFETSQIHLIEISTARVSTLAGDPTRAYGSSNGVGTNSKFSGPQAVSISPDGLFALVMDRTNNMIRRIDIREPPGGYGFGALFGDHTILDPRKALLVDSFISESSGPVLTHRVTNLISSVCPSDLLTPIAVVVNSSLVASPSDPELTSDSIMIKWRSVRTSPLRESCPLLSLSLSPLFAVAHLSLLSRQDSVLGRRTPSLFRVASWCHGWWLSLSRRSLGSLFTVCCPPCPSPDFAL
jgi:hypothetical protein